MIGLERQVNLFFAEIASTQKRPTQNHKHDDCSNTPDIHNVATPASCNSVVLLESTEVGKPLKLRWSAVPKFRLPNTGFFHHLQHPHKSGLQADGDNWNRCGNERSSEPNLPTSKLFESVQVGTVTDSPVCSRRSLCPPQVFVFILNHVTMLVTFST